MWENDLGRVPRVYKKTPHPLAEKSFCQKSHSGNGGEQRIAEMGQKGLELAFLGQNYLFLADFFLEGKSFSPKKVRGIG